MRRFLNAITFGLASLSAGTLAWAADPASATTKPAVASRPASEIVLVRVGNTAITQEDFNRACSTMPPARVANAKAGILRGLIGQRLLSLYLDEHPELVDKAKLDEQIKDALKKEGVNTPEELEAKMKAQGTPGKLEYFIYRARNVMGRTEIMKRNEKSDAYLRELYEKEKAFFDGTRMYVREIRINTLPWDTPEQLQAKRDRAEKIREDLVSGRRTWEQCLTESESPTRISGGDMGYVPRHLEQPEVVAEAAFNMQVGETSKVLEDRSGFYVIQVTKRHEGDTKYEQAKEYMTMWMQWEPLVKIDGEMRAKHKVIGVREPDMPPPPASMPASAATRPARPATRPGFANRVPTSRPARIVPNAGSRKPVLPNEGSRKPGAPAGVARPSASAPK